nr:hypothetical protein [Kibdelosporangium sp. MJ126-NF4]CTQ97399.1 hypothetical protein [Kibdelosporangium sp. MJ126-NF4]
MQNVAEARLIPTVGRITVGGRGGGRARRRLITAHHAR